MIAAGHLGAVLALSLLAGAPAAGDAQAVPLTVAFDLGSLDEETYRRVGGLALQKQAVLRLVQENFAVVSPAASPEILLVAEVIPAGLRLRARSRAGEAAREVPVAPAEPLQELHLEISQKLVELARAVASPAVPPGPEKTSPPPPVAARWWRLDAAAGADALFRKGGNDPQARLGVRWGGQPGVSLVGTFGRSLSPDLRVLEWALLAGPSWREPLKPWLELEAGLLGGALFHNFAVLNEYSHDRSGRRTDWAAALPLTLTFRPIPAVGVSVRVAGRANANGREHVLEGRELWRREALGLEVGGGISGRF